MKTKSRSKVSLRAHLLGLFLGMNVIAVLSVVLFCRVFLEQLGETAFPAVVSETFWICVWLFFAVLTITVVVWACVSLLPRLGRWYNTVMRMTLTLVLFPLVTFGATVSELPPSEFADTEVSTNVCFAIDRATMTRVEFVVSLNATPTNNVEVAIGTDANGDGNLSVEEAAYVFGYDCGVWFKRSQSKSRVEVDSKSKSRVEVEERNLSTCAFGLEEEENHHSSTSTSNFDYSGTSTSNFDFTSHTFVLKSRKLDTSWNLVKVTRRGCGASCELVKAEGRKPGLILEVR